ncbi:MAG: DUF2341 domain-containing protein, partial [Candidatus Hodarchaeales archaeon]
MISKDNLSLILIMSILSLNALAMTISIQKENYLESDELIPAFLRGIGLKGQKNETYQQVTRLLNSSKINSQINKSYPNRVLFSQSEYFIPGWADTRWLYRKNITIDYTKVDANLINFPVYIELYDSDLQQDAQASGNDILFTNASGHLLDHEIEVYERVYNSSHAYLVAWVKTNLSSTQDTIISMYYGNPTAINQENPEDVWDDNYEFVLHMNQDPSISDILDSTKNKFDFKVETTGNMNSDDLVEGIAGKAIALDGSDDFFYLPVSEGFVGPTDKIIFEYWIMFPSGGPSARDYVGAPAIASGDPYLSFYGSAEMHVETGSGSGICDTNLNFESLVGTWQHIVCVWDGTGAGDSRIYVNGTMEDVDNVRLGTHTAWNTFSIGTEDDDIDGPGGDAETDRFIHATLSEFRLSNNIRSPDWIATEFENQNNSTNFYLIGSEEKYSDTVDWHFSGLQYRKELIIDATKVNGTSSLLNFPVLIDIYDSDLHDTDKVQADGDDILFCDTMGRKLDHEIDLFDQNYNPTQAHLVAWVKIPYLSSTTDTPIFMYFGNSDLSSQENPTRVWKSGYVGVWHLSESSGDAIDSTSYETNGTINSGATQGVTGHIDGAYDFDGNGVTIGNPSDGHLDFGTESFSISFWINVDNSTDTYQIPVYKGGTTSSSEGYEVETNQDATALEFGISDGLGNRENRQIPIDLDEWIYFTGIVNRTSNKLHVYKNGVEVGTGIDISSVGSINNDYMMSFSQASNPLDGILDEIRISNVLLTDAWINTEYNSQYDPSTFYSVNSLELRGNWTIPYLRYNKNITIDHSLVSGSGDLTNFPLLLDFYDSDLHDSVKVQADGDDIAFTDEKGLRLDHEIEFFDQDGNGTHAHLLAWVKIPILSVTTDTIIKMWYGSSAVASLANPGGVWNNYGGIWHLSDDLIDSSGNNNDGTNYQSDDVSAKIYRGRDFDGVDDYVNVGSGSSIDNVFTDGATISAWIYPEDWGGYDYGRILDKSTSTSGANGWVFCVDGESSPAANHHLLFYRDFTVKRGLWYSPEDSISLSQWQYVTVTYDDSSTSNWPTIYVNGVSQTLVREENPSGTAENDGAQSLYVADYKDGGRTFGGGIDEIRICYNTLSSEWIQTEFNNQLNPENYITIGTTEETRRWEDASFTYSKDIVINHTNVAEDLINFPCLLNLTDTGLKSGAVQSNGADILFYDPYGRKLNHEIESFSQTSTNGHLITWVKIPYLYSSDYTTITMYYGNSKVSEQENPEGVWDFNYKGVWHLKEDPSSSAPQFIDSTSNDNDGSAVSLSTAHQVPGQIDGSLSFDDIDRNVDIPDDGSLKLNSDICVSAWVKTTDAQTDVDVVLAKWTLAPSGHNYFLGKLNENTFSFYVDENDQHVDISLSKVNDGTWHYVVGLADSVTNQLRLYVDGVLEGTAAYDGSSVTGTSKLYIGQSPGATDQEWNGGIDECRVSNVIHSGNWIDTEYNNQLDPANFHMVTQEFSLDVNPPVINNFGAEDLGTGIGEFWADITDTTSGVDTVIMEINGTEYSMSFNGTYWIYQTAVVFYGYYEFQITNTTDVRGNFITTPSSTKQTTFSKDFVAPDVLKWKYTTATNTFRANVSDSWGEVDTVIVNVTYHSTTLPDPPTQIMSFYQDFGVDGLGYINDTLMMANGDIEFKIYVNDTSVNSFLSSAHPGVVWINHPPIAENLTLSPSPLYSNETLELNYDYYDEDNHGESGTEIRWYKNGVLQTSFNDSTQIDDTYLIPGDDWNVTVRPKDGELFGEINSSTTITVLNTPPVVQVVTLFPPTAYTTSTLSITNTTFDHENDELNYFIEWYWNSQHNISCDNLLTITPDKTTKDESWYCRIRAFDGTSNSSWRSSNSVIIQNSLPQAVNLAITPDPAYTNDTLVASWDMADVDGDAENKSAAIIFWYKYGELQPLLNNCISINPGNTSKDQTWFFRIQVFDGTNYSAAPPTQSGTIVITNSLPIVQNVSIIQTTPLTTDDLEVYGNYSDIDDDTEGVPLIKWYTNSSGTWQQQASYDDLDTLPASATAKGQYWCFGIQVYDQDDYAAEVNSSPVLILNTPPEITNLDLTSNPSTTDDLVATWVDTDNDSDGLTFNITWYLNGIFNSSWGITSSSATLNAGNTSKTDLWSFTVQAFDGEEYSSVVSLGYNVTILNTAPVVNGLTITTDPTTTDDLVANFDYNDVNPADNSSLIFIIKWYKNGLELGLPLANTTTISSENTNKSQVWWFTVQAFDGEAYSTVEESAHREILNTAPVVSNLGLPSSPTTTDDLAATWNESDADNDGLGYTINWYTNSSGTWQQQASYDDLPTLPASATAKGQYWKFYIQLDDSDSDPSTRYSNELNSSPVLVVNTPPEVFNLDLTSTPTTTDDLIATWVDTDNDSDSLTFTITWYLNGIFNSSWSSTSSSAT